MGKKQTTSQLSKRVKVMNKKSKSINKMVKKLILLIIATCTLLVYLSVQLKIPSERFSRSSDQSSK